MTPERRESKGRDRRGQKNKSRRSKITVGAILGALTLAALAWTGVRKSVNIVELIEEAPGVHALVTDTLKVHMQNEVGLDSLISQVTEVLGVVQHDLNWLKCDRGRRRAELVGEEVPECSPWNVRPSEGGN